MRLRDILAGTAALAMMATPVAAAAPSAPSVARASSANDDASNLSPFAAPGAFIGLVLFAAVIAGGIYIAVDDDDGPASP